jgi:hypothetical protein
MEAHDEISDAAHKIGRRLGTDVYGVFEGQRNLIDLAIVGAIALALMKDYISGFADLKKIGQAHRTALAQLIQRIRASQVTAEDKSPSSVEADLIAAKSLANGAELAGRKAAAVQSLLISLNELGLTGAEADACAADVSAIISRALGIPK